MLITNEIIYFELHKTASSHTRKILADMFADGCINIPGHSSYYQVPKSTIGNFEEKLKIGNIRNPWDWYVSVWAYGCQGAGGPYVMLTKQNKRPFKIASVNGIKSTIRRNFIDYPMLEEGLWKKLYSDPDNYDHFNTWLKLILSKDGHDIGEGYKVKRLSKFAGFFTYRYLKLYTYKKGRNRISNYEELKAFDEKNYFIDRIIRNESLHEDLAKIADELNYNPVKFQNIIKKYQERTNKSKRDRDYRKYYNEESVELVAKYDQLIIDKYGYTFE